MLDKEKLIARLKELPLDDAQYWLITGGAMVLYGLREQTSDIDLGCTSELADYLQEKGFPTKQRKMWRFLRIGWRTEWKIRRCSGDFHSRLDLDEASIGQGKRFPGYSADSGKISRI